MRHCCFLVETWTRSDCIRYITWCVWFIWSWILARLLVFPIVLSPVTFFDGIVCWSSPAPKLIYVWWTMIHNWLWFAYPVDVFLLPSFIFEGYSLSFLYVSICLVSRRARFCFSVYDLLNYSFVIDHGQAANIEPEASALHDSEYQLTKNGFSSLGHGKYSGITLCLCF